MLDPTSLETMSVEIYMLFVTIFILLTLYWITFWVRVLVHMRRAVDKSYR